MTRVYQFFCSSLGVSDVLASLTLVGVMSLSERRCLNLAQYDLRCISRASLTENNPTYVGNQRHYENDGQFNVKTSSMSIRCHLLKNASPQLYSDNTIYLYCIISLEQVLSEGH